MTRPDFRILRLMLVTVTLASLSISLPTRFIERAPAPLKSLLRGIAPKAEAAAIHFINGKIGFTSDRTGNKEIFVMNQDGRNPVNLTNNPANDENAHWSADGKQLAFSSNRDGDFEIFSMNADGSNQVQLTSSPGTDGGATWSPDGTKIAFQSVRTGNFEVFIMNADGSNQINLTNTAGNDLQPSWSPDGTKIVFSSFRDGNSEIYVMNADGSNQVRLTNNPTSDQTSSFSPNGTKILFQRHIGSVQHIMLMNADGSNVVQLTDAGSNFAPAFSPDGTKITFDRLNVDHDILTMDADGSNVVQLTNNTFFDSIPSWQPALSPDTVGVYRPSTNQFLLRNSNAAGTPNTTITFGTTGDQPLLGDWNGDGRDDVGVFRPNTGQFLLRLSTVSKSCAICTPFPVLLTLTIDFGDTGDLGVVGDWNGDGIDTVGVFRPATSQWFLTNAPNTNNSSPPIDITLSPFGTAGDIPVTGDWDGDGKDTIGVWRTSTGQFFLSNSDSNPPTSDFILAFGGLGGDLPVVGDWNGDGKDTIGILGVPRNGEVFPNGVGFFLNNSNTVAVNDFVFAFGQSGDIPLAGDVNGN